MYLIIFITTSILNILGLILKLKCRRIDLLSQNIKKRLVLNQLRPRPFLGLQKTGLLWSFVVQSSLFFGLGKFWTSLGLGPAKKLDWTRLPNIK